MMRQRILGLPESIFVPHRQHRLDDALVAVGMSEEPEIDACPARRLAPESPDSAADHETRQGERIDRTEDVLLEERQRPKLEVCEEQATCSAPVPLEPHASREAVTHAVRARASP